MVQITEDILTFEKNVPLRVEALVRLRALMMAPRLSYNSWSGLELVLVGVSFFTGVTTLSSASLLGKESKFNINAKFSVNSTISRFYDKIP